MRNTQSQKKNDFFIKNSFLFKISLYKSIYPIKNPKSNRIFLMNMNKLNK